MNKQHFIDFRNVPDWNENTIIPFEVHTDEETRLRVYGTQLMDEIINNINKFNYLYQAGLYYKLGNNLLQKFPHCHNEINSFNWTFWEKVQTKLKQLSKDEL